MYIVQFKNNLAALKRQTDARKGVVIYNGVPTGRKAFTKAVSLQ
jgi:hypothetical protein